MQSATSIAPGIIGMGMDGVLSQSAGFSGGGNGIGPCLKPAKAGLSFKAHGRNGPSSSALVA